MKITQTFVRTTLCTLAFFFFASCAAPESESSARIVGGDVVSSSHPVARHTVVFVDSDRNVGCSGVIVGPNQILSAAHCWEDGLWSDDLYAAFTTRVSDANFLNSRRLVDVVIHQGYDSEFRDPKAPANDIALLTFEGKLPKGFEPAPLYGSPKKIPAGTEVLLAGFGAVNDDDTHPRMLRMVTTSVGHHNILKKEFYFGPTPGRGPCGGDSGGPAFFPVNGQLYLIGTTSRGVRKFGTCFDGESLYTDVRFFQGWIEAHGDFKMKVSAAR